MPVAATNGCALAPAICSASGTSCGTFPATIAWHQEYSAGSARPGRTPPNAATSPSTSRSTSSDSVTSARYASSIQSTSRAAASRPSIGVVSASPAVAWSSAVILPTLRRDARLRPPMSGGVNVAHGLLRQCRDCQARIHTDVRGDGVAVAYQEVLIAEQPLASVDDAVLRVRPDRRPAED